MGGRHTWLTQLGTRAGRAPSPPTRSCWIHSFNKNMDKKDCLFSSETFLSCSEWGRGFQGTKHAASWEHRPPSPRETLGNRRRTFCLMGIVDGNCRRATGSIRARDLKLYFSQLFLVRFNKCIYKFPLDNFHLQYTSTIIHSSDGVRWHKNLDILEHSDH
jgi:hypothetical protein